MRPRDIADTEKASLNETIKEQGEDIRQAQEQFKQMVSTIENELGTEIPVDVAFNEQPAAQPAEPAPEAVAEPEQVAEPVAEEVAQPEPEPAAEPEPEQVAEPEPESHIIPDTDPAEDEEDIIEVHPANEKEPDLFASNGGSPTGFFG